MQTYNFHYILIKQGSVVIFFFNVGEVRLTAPYKHFSITHTEQVRPPIQTILGPMCWARGTGPAAHPPFGEVLRLQWSRGMSILHPASRIPVLALLLIRHPQATRLPSWPSFGTPTDFTNSPHGLKLYPVFFFSPGKGNLSFFSNESFELH